MQNANVRAALAAVVFSATACTTAQSPAPPARCNSGAEVSAEARLAACTGDIELEPGSAGGWILRGMAYSDLGHYDLAIADFTRALELYPGFGMAEGGLEEAQAAKARIAGGQKLADPHAWCEGKALPEEGFALDLQIQGCTKLIQAGQEKRRDKARAYFNRASAYDFQGDKALAAADYSQSIKLNPKNAKAYGYRGMLRWLETDYASAVTDLRQAIRLEPKSVLYTMYLGQAHLAMNQFDAAIANFNRVLALSPDNPEAFLNRSLARTGKGDYGRAIADCDLAIKHSRTSEATEAYNSRGNIHFHLGDWSNAIRDYDQALKLWPEYPQALFGRGAAKSRYGDVQSGQADIVAVKLQSDVAAVESKLGITPSR